MQTPYIIPPLFPFSRTNVYLVLSPVPEVLPEMVYLHASTLGGDKLELEIPVTKMDAVGEEIHQLAARSFISELERGQGYLYNNVINTLNQEKHPGQWEDIVEREGVRWGEGFAVAGKWTSFVAVQDNDSSQKQTVESPKSNLLRKRGRGGYLGEARYVDRSSSSGKPIDQETETPRRNRGTTDQRIESSGSPSENSRGKARMLMKVAPVTRSQQSQGAPFLGGMAARRARVAPSGLVGGPVMACAITSSATPPPPPAAAAARASFGVSEALEDKDEDEDVAWGGASPSFSPVSDGSSKEEETDLLAKSSSQPSPVHSKSDDDRLQFLIKYQRFSGSYNLDLPLVGCAIAAFALKSDAKDLLRTLQELATKSTVNQDFVGSVLAVLIFEKSSLKAERDVWELIVEKANDWLDSQGGNVDNVKTEIAKILSV